MYDEFFSCTQRERAIFEAGIKLGSIFHQYIGNTFDIKHKEVIEKAIEQSLLSQPYCTHAKAILKIHNAMAHNIITEDLLDIEITVQVGKEKINGYIKYTNNYPLIFFK